MVRSSGFESNGASIDVWWPLVDDRERANSPPCAECSVGFLDYLSNDLELKKRRSNHRQRKWLFQNPSRQPRRKCDFTPRAAMERKDETRVKGFDLPPGAGRGTDDKGHVSLTVDGLEWQLRGAPPWVRVTARWWGDELSDKRTRPWAKLVDGPGASASMTFPVKAKPAGFSRYCRDARAVVLEVGSIHARPTRLAPDSKSASLQTSHRRSRLADPRSPTASYPSPDPPTSFPTGAPRGTSPAPASTSPASKSTAP